VTAYRRGFLALDLSKFRVIDSTGKVAPRAESVSFSGSPFVLFGCSRPDWQSATLFPFLLLPRRRDL